MLYVVFKTLHIASALWLVAGIAGREISRVQARRASKLSLFAAYNGRAGRFESLMVIPGNMAVVLFGLALGFMGRWPILGFLQGSSTNWLLVSNLLIVGGMLLVPFVYAPRRERFDVALKNAISEDRITPELQALMDESAIKWAHRGEYLGLFLVFVLMIFKPF